MVIEGEALERARKRMGYRSQEEAARAMGVSLRKFGDLERHGVPAKYEAAARRAFWPGVAREPDPVAGLAAFDDMELLTEIARRFALYKREAAEREDYTPTEVSGSEFGQSSSEVHARTISASTVPTGPPNGGAVRGRLGKPPRAE